MTAPPRARRDCTCPRARHTHGTKLAYNYDRCRCDECRAAVGAHNVRYYRTRTELRWAGRSLTVDGTGTRRRLRALGALGWTSKDLAARLNVTRQAVSAIQHNADRPALASTAARIARLYDELSMRRPSPWRPVNVRRMRSAERYGWAPPLAWDDDTIDDPTARPNIGPDAHRYGVGRPTESVPDVVDGIAVERAIRGDHVRLTAAEKAEAVATLTRWGLSAAQIAQRIGTSERLVTRKRSAA